MATQAYMKTAMQVFALRNTIGDLRFNAMKLQITVARQAGLRAGERLMTNPD